MALPRKNRLIAKKDIDRVFKNGGTVKGSFLFIRFLGNRQERSRFAFIIPAKYIPLSVDRNRLKREFSAEAAKSGAVLRVNYDTIAVLYRKTQKEKFRYLIQEFTELLLKL